MKENRFESAADPLADADADSSMMTVHSGMHRINAELPMLMTHESIVCKAKIGIGNRHAARENRLCYVF
jgi:hypothetical protein